MRQIFVETRAIAMQKAKQYVEKRAGVLPSERRWLVGTPPDSYGDPHYRVEMHVLEGSPPKGWVVVRGETRGFAVGMNGACEYPCRWSW